MKCSFMIRQNYLLSTIFTFLYIMCILYYIKVLYTLRDCMINVLHIELIESYVYFLFYILSAHLHYLHFITLDAVFFRLSKLI